MLNAFEAKVMTLRELERLDMEQARSLIAEVEAMIRAAIARRGFSICVEGPNVQRFNVGELTKHLREAGYKVDFGTTRKPRFVVSWGGAVSP